VPSERCAQIVDKRHFARARRCSLASSRQRRRASFLRRARTSCLCTGCNGSGRVELPLVVPSGCEVGASRDASKSREAAVRSGGNRCRSHGVTNEEPLHVDLASRPRPRISDHPLPPGGAMWPGLDALARTLADDVACVGDGRHPPPASRGSGSRRPLSRPARRTRAHGAELQTRFDLTADRARASRAQHGRR
jgi:hypothetical protein